MTAPQTPDPHAGLSATGRTADQLSAGEPSPGTTYGDPGGTGTTDEEVPAAGEGAGEPPADL
jgi:hypothetical protein